MAISLRRTLFGRSGTNRYRYVGGVAVLALGLFAVSYLLLSEGWWNEGEKTLVVLGIMMMAAAVAGYQQYGVVLGIVGAYLPLLALLLRGEYIDTPLGSQSIPPLNYVAGMVGIFILFAIPIGIVGYALGYILNITKNHVLPTSSTT